MNRNDRTEVDYTFGTWVFFCLIRQGTVLAIFEDRNMQH